MEESNKALRSSLGPELSVASSQKPLDLPPNGTPQV